MALRPLSPVLLVVGFFIALSGGIVRPVRGQDDPRPDERKKEDLLPEGAKLRLGYGLPFRFASGFTLLPPDYRTLLVLDAQGSLERYDVATGRGRAGAGAPAPGPVIVSVNGNRYVQARAGRLSIRDAATGRVVADIDPQQGFSTAGNATNASLSADGGRVAHGGQSANGMGHVVVHDVATKELIFQAPMQYAGTVIPMLSEDGRYLATRRHQVVLRDDMKEDRRVAFTAQIWDVDNGKELFRAAVTGGGPINGMAFSRDGKILGVSSGEGPIDLWEVPGGKLRVTVLGRTRQGMQLAFSADGKTLAALSRAGVVQRWNVADGILIDSTEWPAENPITYPRGLAFTADGRVVAWAMSGPVPVVWEVPSGKVLSRFPEHLDAIRGIAFAAGGKEIITAGQEGRINRWDASSGKLLGPITLKMSRETTPGPWRAIVGIAPDGSRAITGGIPGAIYELPSGKELFAIPGGGLGSGQTRMMTVSPDLATAITLSTPIDRKSPGSATVWDLVRARKLGEIETDPGALLMSAAAVSPEGKRLTVAATRVDPGKSQKLTITTWDLESGKQLCREEVAKFSGQAKLEAADESTVLVADTSGKLRRLNIERGTFGEDLEPVSASPIAPSPIVFSRDRTRFAVGVTEGTELHGVRIHEWPSGKVLHTFKCNSSQISALCFAADGKRLASGSYDGTTLVWDLAAIGK